MAGEPLEFPAASVWVKPKKWTPGLRAGLTVQLNPPSPEISGLSAQGTGIEPPR